jgi:hypothetical protein
VKCYLDSSVVLRKLFGQSGQLREWSKIAIGFSSRMLRLECLRTIDRMRLVGAMTDPQTAQCRSDFYRLLNNLGLLPVTEDVLARAEQPFATPLGSLDGVHLATALLWREKGHPDFGFATHDLELATAAQAHGLTVIGV